MDKPLHKWYSIINNKNKRYFICKVKNTKKTFFFANEEGNDLKKVSLKKLKENNFKIVGEAFEDEKEKIEKGIKLSLLIQAVSTVMMN